MTKIILSRCSAVVLFLIAWRSLTATAAGSLPEAITPTNTLPPSAGTYVLWPPERIVKFNGSLNYLGTNYPAVFHLKQIEVGLFTNVVRTVAGNDLLLEFDAEMGTRVPYAELTQTVLSNVALYNQIGHFRIRVVEGNGPATNHLALIMESFSWTYQARMGQQYYDFIHVRNATNRISSGWIEITSLPGGQYAMQSELRIFPEGIVLPPPGMNPPFEMDYTPAEDSPVHLVLTGVARSLQILHVWRGDDTRLNLWKTWMGSSYRYGIELSTNGVTWQDYVWTNFWGQEMRWLDSSDDVDTWEDATPVAPMKLFRLKAQPWP